MPLDFHQLLRLGKKWWPKLKRWYAKHQQDSQQHQQQQQQHQQQQNPYGPPTNNNQAHNQNPYPQQHGNNSYHPNQQQQNPYGPPPQNSQGSDPNPYGPPPAQQHGNNVNKPHQQQQQNPYGSAPSQHDHNTYGAPNNPGHHKYPTKPIHNHDTSAVGPHHPGNQVRSSPPSSPLRCHDLFESILMLIFAITLFTYSYGTDYRHPNLAPGNHDQLNASNSHYVTLRNQAIHEGDLMARAFQDSHSAYSSGDGAKAKDLSNEGHEHQRNRDRINADASKWIYTENNKESPSGTIDLHGLYVQEAIQYTEEAIKRHQSSGAQTLRVIVGKGNHSAGHVVKIKPAIEDLMRKYGLSARIDEHNTGVLIVDLTGQTGSRDAGFADRMSNNSDECTIM